MNLKNYETTNVILNPDNDSNLKHFHFHSSAWRWLHPIPTFSSPFSEILFRLAVLGLILLSLALSAHACGPDFPNNLLDRGDEALLSAPVASFERELERLNLAPNRFESVPATNGYDEQTIDAEMADLTAALKKAKVSSTESVRIVEGHRVNRAKLRKFQEELDLWTNHDPVRAWADDNGNPQDPRGPCPAFPNFADVPDLPGEFADYFNGAIELRRPEAKQETAREAWERLLARPAAERKYKSTWATFMLGKSWEQEDDDKAVEYFQRTRDLAKHGFADSPGLATAAIGLEARVELRRKHFKQAIELYLEQYATGDSSAAVSLRWAAGEALAAGGDDLAALAATANTRAVVTAYLICGERGERFAASGSPATNSVAVWLEAVEAAGVKDVDSAERFALAAYQEGEFETAQRWVNRARNTPVAQWLQAKLLLRAGKIPQAAALIAKVLNQLPPVVESDSTNAAEFVDNLRMDAGQREFLSARSQMSGELGVLELSRSEFAQALDALLRSGFWQDAAYVAERVLTADELKKYVDENWPAASVESDQSDMRGKDIRYLLARRLTREMHSDQAREYYPEEWRPRFDELVGALNAGWNENSRAEQRAKALFEAAYIARTNGMELLGTEMAPDWFVHSGSFQEGLTWKDRATQSQSSRLNVAGEEELNRAAQHKADPEVRFHYRYQAAFLAWEAAKLMPNNSDETAHVLHTAGSWLQLRDPETADIFYKALVRRCRKTALGREADMVRWFPELDENGNLRRRRDDVRPAIAVESPAGYEFVIEPGDTLFAIAKAYSQHGVSVTVDDMLEANPNLQPTRLQTGKKIFVPVAVPLPPPETTE